MLVRANYVLCVGEYSNHWILHAWYSLPLFAGIVVRCVCVYAYNMTIAQIYASNHLMIDERTIHEIWFYGFGFVHMALKFQEWSRRLRECSDAWAEARVRYLQRIPYAWQPTWPLSITHFNGGWMQRNVNEWRWTLNRLIGTSGFCSKKKRRNVFGRFMQKHSDFYRFIVTHFELNH